MNARVLDRGLLYGSAIFLAIWVLVPFYLIAISAFTPQAKIFDYPKPLVPTSFSTETMQFMLLPLVNEKRDPVGSMGNDSALAVLSDQPRMIYDYFKQLFAQVTNPPIDSIREERPRIMIVRKLRRGVPETFGGVSGGGLWRVFVHWSASTKLPGQKISKVWPSVNRTSLMVIA